MYFMPHAKHNGPNRVLKGLLMALRTTKTPASSGAQLM